MGSLVSWEGKVYRGCKFGSQEEKYMLTSERVCFCHKGKRFLTAVAVRDEEVNSIFDVKNKINATLIGIQRTSFCLLYRKITV